MSAFQIGNSPFRPTQGVTGGKKPERKAEETAAPRKGSFDQGSFHANPLAVMPRMSALGGQTAQLERGEAVESLLRDSSAELDDYFTKAYGFKE